ncbi:MAG: alpha/beta fold hydrolase [Acidimicrobiia bacterium]
MSDRRPTSFEGDEPALRVRSRDGTEIALWQTGSGPTLVLAHGTPADHTRWRPLLPYLEPHFTVYTLDRRGRGASTDSPNYALEREFEDVAAVVETVAVGNAGAVTVYGHSFGGNVAFGAATMTSSIERLVLYEGWPVPDPSVWALPGDLEARMDALLAAGDRDAVVELLFRELEDLSDEDMATFKTAPSWPGRVAAAHTITREIRGLMTSRLDDDTARTIAVPVLLVTGEHSVDLAQPHASALAETLPHGKVLVLHGQGHVADVLDPELFTATVLPFLKGDS